MTRLFLYFSTMILPFEHYLADQDSPELYQAFNATPLDSAPKTMSNGPQDADHMDAHTYSLFLAYGDTLGN